MIKLTIFIFIFSICSQACSPYPEIHSIRDAASNEKIVCPAHDFSNFIKVFSENVNIQIAFTKYPLQQQKLDLNAEPEPKPVMRKLLRDQVLFPVMPNALERRKKSLVLKIDEERLNHVNLTIFKEDTDYKVSYFFKKYSCWHLERIEDWSL